MLSEQELQARLQAANEKFVSGEEVLNAPPAPNAAPVETRTIGTNQSVTPFSPVDIYQRDAIRRAQNSKKSFPNGSSALVMAVTKAVIDGEGSLEGLARAKQRMEGDSDVLARRGEKQRAALLSQQYMQEKFLPAIEAVVNYTSPDELLNCKEALSALDKMAIGLGSMQGYTAAYVREAYGNQLGQKEGKSDPTVVDAVRRIRTLSDKDEIRTAIGVAAKIKKQIDNGEHIASDDDYALIGRVVAYAN